LSRPGPLFLVLHAHLPWVRHPGHPRFLEEAWLFQALLESHLRLLQGLQRLWGTGHGFRITLSLSPTLVGMWRDPLLRERFRAYVGRTRRLARRRAGDLPSELATRLLDFEADYARLEAWWREDLGMDLESAWCRLRDRGAVELITTALTHGYLPLLRHHPGAVEAQLDLALAFHERWSGRRPGGFWLPEMGYFPGLERILARRDLRWFCVDSHALPGLAVARCPAGPVCLARDAACTREVWSRSGGFPGDPAYREFHREIRADDGEPTGLKPWRIGAGGRSRAPYDPRTAAGRARADAHRFLARRRLCPAPQLAAYDAELFGHWWYEGVDWLLEVLRAAPDYGIETLTPMDWLARGPLLPEATPLESSWGEGGYHRVWLHEDSAWIWPRLARIQKGLVDAAARGGSPGRLGPARHALLLAQASDWPFMLRPGVYPEYARMRVTRHLEEAERRLWAASTGEVEAGPLPLFE